MAKHNSTNKAYWNSLNKLKDPIDDKEIDNIFASTLDKYYGLAYNAMPYKYGGLRNSLEAELYRTGKSIVASLGVPNTAHKYLGPNPDIINDDVTNKELLLQLATILNKSTTKANTVIELINESFAEELSSKIAIYWKNKKWS